MAATLGDDFANQLEIIRLGHDYSPPGPLRLSKVVTNEKPSLHAFHICISSTWLATRLNFIYTSHAPATRKGACSRPVGNADGVAPVTQQPPNG